MDQVLWEFVPDRRNYPPVIRSLIRQPPQRVRFDGSSIVFDGPFVHDAVPVHEPGASTYYKERSHKRRRDPIPVDDIERVRVYPVIGGFEGNGSATRSRYTVIDVHRRNAGRTVARIARILGITPSAEAELDAAMQQFFGRRWQAPADDDVFAGRLDRDRLEEWPHAGPSATA